MERLIVQSPDGVAISVIKTGAGPALLLIHGALLNATLSWAAVLPRSEDPRSNKRPGRFVSRWRQINMLRWTAVFALLTIPFAAQAGAIRMWRVKEAAAAPLIVTARVVSAEKYERVPDGVLPWKDETWEMTATVEVLRAFPNPEKQLVGSQLRIRYMAYGPSVTFMMNGYPPPLPRFEPGQVMILPLQVNANPLSEPSRLLGDHGVGLTIPAVAGMKDTGDQPASGRAFVMREIANSLATGTPRDIAAAGRYLAGQFDDPALELMPSLSAAIGDDRERWAQVAAGILAVQGTPRPGVAELMGEKTDKAWATRGSLLLARAALQQLKASPETDTLLIHTWIANAPANAWGAANSLIEYGDNPVTTETLRKALNDDVAGSSYIAWILAQNGHKAVLSEALARALRLVDRTPIGDYDDVQGAAALLRDFGNDQQLRHLAAVVAKYQIQDHEYYSALWQYATEASNPREARVLAVVLRDHNPVPRSDIRVCDFAVGVLERAVGQKFGADGKTLVERDAAVSHAMAWLATNGFAN
jgi:hypothetical protein